MFSYQKIAPIHLATDKAMLATLIELVEHGCNLNVKDKDGLTPLEIAAEHNNHEIFQFLLENNAKVPEKYLNSQRNMKQL